MSSDNERIFKKSDDVRLVMGILIGMACVSDTRRNEIKALTPFRDNLPRDLVMLLEAVEAKDGEKVFRWFDNKGINLTRGEGVKLPMAIAGHLMRFHWWSESNKILGRMNDIKEMPVGEMMFRMQQAVKMLEDAKIQPVEPKPQPVKTPGSYWVPEDWQPDPLPKLEEPPDVITGQQTT